MFHNSNNNPKVKIFHTVWAVCLKALFEKSYWILYVTCYLVTCLQSFHFESILKALRDTVQGSDIRIWIWNNLCTVFLHVLHGLQDTSDYRSTSAGMWWTLPYYHQCCRMILRPSQFPQAATCGSFPPTKPQPSCGRAPGSTGPQLLTRMPFCQEDSLPRNPSQLMSIIGPLLPQPWIFELESWCNSKNSRRAKDLIHAAFSAAFSDSPDIQSLTGPIKSCRLQTW